MRISRRGALTGASAAVAATIVPAVAGAATLPVAVDSDARIFALVEEYDRTFSEMHKGKDRWGEAMTEKMPPHLQHVSPVDFKDPLRKEAFAAAMKALEHPEIKELQAPGDRLQERCREIAERLAQTEATTLKSVCTKMRFATRGWSRKKGDILRSVAADVERLAGEARP